MNPLLGVIQFWMGSLQEMASMEQLPTRSEAHDLSLVAQPVVEINVQRAPYDFEIGQARDICKLGIVPNLHVATSRPN